MNTIKYITKFGGYILIIIKTGVVSVFNRDGMGISLSRPDLYSTSNFGPSSVVECN